MDREAIEVLLQRVVDGAVTPAQAADVLRTLPFERLGDAVVLDHHRSLRAGVPEVVLGEHKAADDIARIVSALAARGAGALATRVSADKAARVCELVPAARHHPGARAVVVSPREPRAPAGAVAVVAAGTSDAPVADEACVTLEFLGCAVDRIVDVGVAGLHRLLAHVDRIRAADVAIVVAGMEGALPSVVAGLIEAPVIAVPTSVGYGVSAGGFAALVGMLSSCAPGVLVVNIDNGFGAAVGAALIARTAARAARGAARQAGSGAAARAATGRPAGAGEGARDA